LGVNGKPVVTLACVLFLPFFYFRLLFWTFDPLVGLGTRFRLLLWGEQNWEGCAH